MAWFLRRLGGMTALVIGLAGVVFSVWAGYEVWMTAERLRQDVPMTLGQIEGIVHSVHSQTKASADLLQSARGQLKAVGRSVDRLTRSDESQAAAASILDRLNEDVDKQLQAAGEFIVSLQGSMRGLGSALALADALPFFAPRTDPEAGQASQLDAVARSLNETADLLEQVRVTLATLRDGRGVPPQQVALLHDTLGQVDRELAMAHREVRRFGGRVKWTADALTRWKHAAPERINTIATATTMFLVCFGASQISLLLHGWSWLTRRAEIPTTIDPIGERGA